MKLNVTIIIRRGMLRKTKGAPTELIKSSLALAAVAWADNKTADATPEQFLQAAHAALAESLERLGYPCKSTETAAQEKDVSKTKETT